MKHKTLSGLGLLFVAVLVFSFALTISADMAGATCNPCCTIRNGQGQIIGRGALVGWPGNCAGFCNCGGGEPDCVYACPQHR